MYQPNSYIVIVSPGLSGAEKRFFDIYCGLLAKGKKICLIVPSMLASMLRAEYSDRGVFEHIIEIRMEKWSRVLFMYKFYKLLRLLDKGSQFHYPMNALPFLHFFRGDLLTMSLCDCEVSPAPGLLAKKGIYTYITLLFAEKIDVLSPQIYQETLLLKPLRNKLSLTPGGTFVGGFKKKMVVKKSPVVAMIGRLEPGKGINDFLDIFPEIWAIIKDSAPSGFQLRIAGTGSLLNDVRHKIASMQSNGIAIHYNGFVQVDEFLKDVSVVLSMQELTNYPSRVVAEALISGACVIIRNTGDSKMFGEILPGLLYCNADLDANELASLMLSVFQKYKDNDQLGDDIRQKAQEAFCSKKYIDYFDSIISSQ